MRRREALAPFQPFVFTKAYSFGLPEPCVAVLEVHDGYFALEFRMGEQQVVSYAVKKYEFEARVTQFKRTQDNVEEVLALLKKKALTHGATLEAIQLFGALRPLTKEEEASMATNKLQKADTAALKGAAKEAPVGGKVKAAPKAEVAKSGGKGNPEALAKARAARSEANAGPDKRKITVLKKPHGARDGSTRAEILDKIYKAKTVQDAVDAGVKKNDVAWAARAEYISVG